MKKRIKFTLFLLKERGLRTAIVYTLFTLGYYKILPSNIIRSVKINKIENKTGENFVDVRIFMKDEKCKGVIFDEKIPSFYTRESIAFKICKIREEVLPLGYGVFIHSMYRDLKEQTLRFEKRKQEVKDLNKGKDLTDEEIESIAKKFTAMPSLFSPHVTGSAIDLCFYNLQTGKKLLHGTEIREMSEKTPFASQCITEEQKKNRMFLRKTMEKHDFVCYPGEWWHYSYGDQAWAAYRGESRAFYGGIASLE